MICMMIEEDGHIELFNKVKEKLIEENKLDLVDELTQNFSKYYPKILGNFPQEEFNKKMLSFVQKEIKRLKIEL